MPPTGLVIPHGIDDQEMPTRLEPIGELEEPVKESIFFAILYGAILQEQALFFYVVEVNTL